mgnify:FL=1
MFVEIEWMDRRFGVPLAQLEPIDPDANTKRGDQRLALLGGRRNPNPVATNYNRFWTLTIVVGHNR